MDGNTIKTLAEYIAQLRSNDQQLNQQLSQHSDFDTTIHQSTEKDSDTSEKDV